MLSLKILIVAWTNIIQSEKQGPWSVLGVEKTKNDNFLYRVINYIKKPKENRFDDGRKLNMYKIYMYVYSYVLGLTLDLSTDLWWNMGHWCLYIDEHTIAFTSKYIKLKGLKLFFKLYSIFMIQIWVKSLFVKIIKGRREIARVGAFFFLTCNLINKFYNLTQNCE